LAELMSSIHGIMFAAADWRQAFNFANDAGHTENGVYALRANYGHAGLTVKDLRGFRSISSKLTGHGESHLYPEGVMVSNGPLGSSLPVAQGLALADRLADNDRCTICVISDGAMMEGEAKEAVTAVPGLAAKDLVNPFVLVIEVQ
jgi:transketolase